jgi:uncharacterized membrane protein YphA (DoxX/SURF4 family)
VSGATSSFPDRSLGLGCVILRLAAGAWLAAAALEHLFVGLDATSTTRGALLSVFGLLLAVCALAIVVGRFARLACVVAALASLAITTNQLWAPGVGSLPYRSWSEAALAMAVALALVWTGPGAYSLDGRIFGHHEISIPPQTRSGDPV